MLFPLPPYSPPPHPTAYFATYLNAAKRGAIPAAHNLVGGHCDDPAALIVDQTMPHGRCVAVPPRQDVHRIGVPKDNSSAHPGRSHESVTALGENEARESELSIIHFDVSTSRYKRVSRSSFLWVTNSTGLCNTTGMGRCNFQRWKYVAWSI